METSKQVSHRKNRGYNGNPLAYFRSHPEEFEQYKNRSQLSKGDSGMYRSLSRAEQLEEAIPEADELLVERGRMVGRGDFDLSPQDITEIINAHNTYDSNASEASRHLHHNTDTILRIWKRGNLKIRKYKLDNSKISAVLSSYKKYNGNALEASKHLPHNPFTIIKYWRKAGLEIRKRGESENKGLSEMQKKEIVSLYDSCNGNALKASKHLPCAHFTIIKYWRKAGLEIREVGRPRKK